MCISCYSQKEQKLKITRKIKTYSVLERCNLKGKKDASTVVIIPKITCDLFGCG
jgi:hypothetical protein